MDLYVLDSTFGKVALIDDFFELVWTERYSSMGDFVLKMPSNTAYRSLFTAMPRLTIPQSKRVMCVEIVEDAIEENGTSYLRVTGRSLEMVLENRSAWRDITTADPVNLEWTMLGTPAEIARAVTESIIITGLLSPYDVIPNLSSASIFPADTIPETAGSISIKIDPGPLYNFLTSMAEKYKFGFRLVRETDTDQLYFNVYTGVNRTSLQNTYPAIIFSPELDNMFNTTELTSISGAKNVAYVISNRGIKTVYLDGIDPTISGLDRRVLTLKVDIPADDPATGLFYDVQAQLQVAGLNALAEAQGFRAFDGEVQFPRALEYGTGFNLGDLVELRNKDGITTYKRVTEYIFTSGPEGDKSYPTLTEPITL